jgi:dTDP-4-amino-4,6-dideoxygalactose transaminase
MAPHRIQVMRPRLPPAERLLPYLRRVDQTRIYSNWGPLERELAERLGVHLGVPGGVMTASSGTAALVGGILAVAGRAQAARPLAVVPSFTFIATAAAVEQCGYEPLILDIDRETWTLDASALLRQPALDRVGVVVPVAPFGRPVAQAPWRSFEAATGIPVVIDGAASFDVIAESPDPAIGDVPLALSFHATKAFATGEGGAVVCTNPALVDRVGEALNFGLSVSRDSMAPSINGKLSEYHAAVGLAELDGWDDKRRALHDVASRYRAALRADGLEGRLESAVSSAYCLFRCESADEVVRLLAALDAHGIDHRRWYGSGLHRQTHLRGLPHPPAPVTEAVSQQLVGLPVAPDLSDEDIARVARALAAGVT